MNIELRNRMKKITAIILFALFSTALPSQITLSGTISSEHFNEFLDSCIIRLRPISPTGKADSTITNNKGRYTLSNTWPGVYIISAEKADYLVDSLQVVVNNSEIVDFTLFKADHSYSTDLPDSLKKANSPFFITQTIIVDHSCYVDSGVYIYIKDSLVINGPSFRALGSSSDSIRFKGIGNNSCLILSSSSQNFTRCCFDSIAQLHLISGNPKRVFFEDCSFKSISELWSDASGLITINNSRFLKCGVSLLFDTVTFTGNIIYSPYNNFDLGARSKGKLCDNSFLSWSSIYSQFSNDTIVNNIFVNFQYNREGTKPIFFAYNCFPEGSVELPGVGHPVIRNDFGEPCDLYMNIFSDPLIADSTTGALQNNSPCLKAGSNSSNIGVWKKEGFSVKVSRVGINNHREKSSIARPFFILNKEYSRNYPPYGLNSNTIGCVSLFSLDGRRVTSFHRSSGNSGGTGNSQAMAKGYYLLK
jgi:hypothetical protein